MMLVLRFELHLLARPLFFGHSWTDSAWLSERLPTTPPSILHRQVHSFKRDVNDSERESFHEACGKDCHWESLVLGSHACSRGDVLPRGSAHKWAACLEFWETSRAVLEVTQGCVLDLEEHVSFYYQRYFKKTLALKVSAPV